MLVPAAAKADSVNTQVGVVAGFNVSDINCADYDFDSKFGFHVGVIGQLNFHENGGLYLNAGILLSDKGAKMSGIALDDEFTGIEKFDGTFNAYYFDIPVHVGYKYVLNNDVALFGEAGPYFGIGAFGKTTIKAGGVKVGETDTFDSEDGFMKRFDFGLGFRLGVELIQKIPVSVGWDFSVIDTSNVIEKFHNSNFLFSVGYKF